MELKSIYSAFVQAQKGFAPALKTNTNPHFKSKYADLGACVEAVLDSLNANGIGLVQKTHADDTGVTVETVLIHESGESMSGGLLHVPAPKQDPQGYGSALSYARRYSLMAACGIAPEDDDGNAATKAPKIVHGAADSVLKDNPPIHPNRQAELLMLSETVASDFAAYGAQAAFERIEEHGLDYVEKIYLSTLLGSKISNQIKAYSVASRQPKKATA